jgi:peptidoglycan/xylan/chitin deacetylase (PgdA/CDA1 family)
VKKAIKYISFFLLVSLFLSMYSCSDKAEQTKKTDTETVYQTDDTSAPPETETETPPLPPETENTDTEPDFSIDSAPSEIDWTPITETEEFMILGQDTEPAVQEPVPQPQIYVPNGKVAPLALMYHLILDQPYSALESLFVRPSELRGHIEALLEKGYTFIFADEYAYSDQKTVIMSFDDGYIDNYTEMFPIIKEYNVKVTVFMITNYIDGADYLSTDMIKEMAASGLVSFQSHTASHPALPSVSDDSMRYEFQTSNERLENLTGRPVRALCYPTGAVDARTVSVVQGYYDFAYTTVSTNTTAGYSVYELPRLRVNRGISKENFKSMIP